MPRRSKVMTLPREVREQLDALLVERGFSGYSDLVAWLAAQGHQVSRSAVQRHGEKLEHRIEQIRIATEYANALIAASPDDAGAVADASLRLAQQRIFDLLLAAEAGDLKELSGAARALAETARAGTTVRAERRRALAEAGKKAEEVAKRRGLSSDASAAIRAEIEGMAA